MNADDAAPSEGNVNRSPLRAAWRAGLSQATRELLDDDERVFLRQSLSTPSLDVIERAEGATLIDAEGRRILDFQGDGVHQLGDVRSPPSTSPVIPLAKG